MVKVKGERSKEKGSEVQRSGSKVKGFCLLLVTGHLFFGSAANLKGPSRNRGPPHITVFDFKYLGFVYHLKSEPFIESHILV